MQLCWSLITSIPALKSEGLWFLLEGCCGLFYVMTAEGQETIHCWLGWGNLIKW